ncbi:peroxiredoxin Q/BCP [Rhizobium sp. RU35A]|uniref:thioredoxin-dependent peroxiredoxin n=1 Tax=Rhizobium straminoryzae TaxID=1387186 RepID=A0A549TGE1_9HYPH|nr:MULTISPECIES: thioredoxin-dependent thiol peroxidase [Rhizobium]TRL41842.1 thioredoxin-dependent thiol peroxidase [Rhizobium straminoryzae]SIR00409.1 peroxiredoxin Q/BCP [Rhizobium sp. RU35A]
MSELVSGMPAPDFTLPRDGGGTITLSDLRGKPVVVYFYPKDDTSGCTTEALQFTALSGEFEKAGTTVIGISPDSAAKHDKFIKKHNLTVALAADEEQVAANAYGVWKEKSMYGKKYMGIERSTFLIAADGSIARVWPKVKVEGHAEEVLAAAQAL